MQLTYSLTWIQKIIISSPSFIRRTWLCANWPRFTLKSSANPCLVHRTFKTLLSTMVFVLLAWIFATFTICTLQSDNRVEGQNSYLLHPWVIRYVVNGISCETWEESNRAKYLTSLTWTPSPLFTSITSFTSLFAVSSVYASRLRSKVRKREIIKLMIVNYCSIQRDDREWKYQK